MTKINKTKLALLGATAFLSATTAHAQVADSWTIGGEINVTATNTAETTELAPLDAGVEGAAITDGFKNSISGSAVGASASSSFTSVNNSGLGGATELNLSDATLNVAAGNSSAVTNNTDMVGSATITAGSGNSISLAAVGSSSSVSASTTLSDAAGGASGAAVTGGETFAYSAGATTISSGAADGSTDDSGNTGAVTLNLASGLNTGTITDGQSNSISVAGVGSSSSFSFAATAGGTADASTLDSASLTLADGATISAANGEDATVQVNLGGGILLPTITAGNGNGISAAAVGSSASFSAASTAFAGGVITEFGGEVGALQVDSTNAAGVSLAAADGADATTITDGTISAGNGNSISATAVGSSGSVSYANTVYAGGNGALAGTVSFTDAVTVNSTNSGSVSNTTSLVQDANDFGGVIADGNRNSISIAGIGSSASQSLSATDYSGAGITGMNSSLEGGVTLASLNSGAVSVTGALQTPTIQLGFSNSISAAAVGASASQSVSRTLVGAP